MRNNITILYPGLENQALANSYPRTKEAVEYITTDPEAVTEAWLKERHKGVEASAVCALMGCGFDNKNKLDLYNECLGIAPEQPLTPTMEFKHDYEPINVKKFCKVTGAIADEGSSVDFLVIDNEKPYLRISPNRFIWEKGTAPADRTLDNAVILECKTCSKAFAKDANGICNNDELPDEWYCQVQYQMGVCGIKYCYLAWFNKLGQDWATTRGYFVIQFNQSFYDSIVAAIDNFWLNHIVPHIAPAPETGADVQALYPIEEKGALYIGSDEDRARLKSLININNQIKKLSEQKNALEDALKVSIAGNEGMIGDDNKLWLTFKASKESLKFEKDLFIAENPELYQRYVHPVPGSRRFSIKIDYESL